MGEADRSVTTLEDPCEEGLRLAGVARAAGVPLRLMGGVAVWARCPSVREPPLRRDYADVDFVSRSRSRSELVRLFEQQGYQPDRLFNALHGDRRLNFADPTRGRPVDVILDRFSMCHSIDLDERLESDDVTLPLAELLLTKLQIVELNDKDLKDLFALLVDHRPAESDDAGINLPRILALTAQDWGLEHTITRTLARVSLAAPGSGLPEVTVATIVARAGSIIETLARAPKTLRWKLRARIGERVRWYELPEEARR